MGRDGLAAEIRDGSEMGLQYINERTTTPTSSTLGTAVGR